VQPRIAWTILLLCAACAAPPRADQLAALAQRIEKQRERSARVERSIREIDPDASTPDAPKTPVPYYELVTFRSEEPIDARYQPLLRGELVAALESSGARSFEIREQGRPPRRFEPPWQGNAFEGASLAALFAASNAAKAQYRGAEFDVRVPLEPGPDRRVTVIHGLDGAISALEAETRDPRIDPDGPDATELRTRFGVGEISGWNGPERASLARALELLRPAERAAIAGLPFARRRGKPFFALRDGPRHCGHFELEQQERAIAVYDCAFDADEHAFVGPLDRPLRPSVRIILHEIGHALSAAPLGSLLADLATSQREIQAMVDAFNRLGRSVAPDEIERVRSLQSEIQQMQGELTGWHQQLQGVDHLHTRTVSAFTRLPGAGSGFTPYGRSSAVEGFAEAFSLCRADPPAGRRISPEICAYFDGNWVRAPR